MFNMEEMPEGLTIKSFSRGNGSWIDYINGDGDEDTFKPSLTGSTATGVVLGMCMEQDINGDIVMWQGDHTDFLRVTFTVSPDFKGGEIKWAVEPSGGTCPPNAHYELSATWTVEAGQVDPTPAPAPTIGLNDAGQVVATCDGPNTVQLYLNGAAVNQPYTLPEQTWEVQTLTFTATTLPGENEIATESAEPFVVTIPALQPQPATAPEIVVENGFVTAVGPEGHTTVLMLEGAVVNQPYPLPAAGEDDVTLHFTAYTVAGEHELNSATVSRDVVIEGTGPVTPTHTCERPECAYSITGVQEVTVTITNNEPEATVYWTYVDPETNETVTGSFTGASEQIVVNGIGVYTITCWASIDDPDWADSPEGGCFFEITEQTAPPTAINELVNGKTVAGVRYFNMAGQEMTEANGMTIVVTTYTDGTTSAVKVMK